MAGGRPRIVRVQEPGEQAAPPQERQRVAVDYNHKLEVVAHYLAHGSISRTVAQFFPEASGTELRSKKQQIMSWKRNHAKIAAICESGGGRKTNDRKRGMGATLSSRAEERLVAWVHAEHTAGRSIPSKTLTDKALEVAKEDKLHPDCFKASWAWRQSFLRRHGFTQGAQRPTGMQESVDAGASASSTKAALRTLPSLSKALKPMSRSDE
ncbi:hypothetical protein BBJ28_00016637 [Nothophytophthora sp. Chile5]|nr:hypothetical protein BBJ28_00016637 [Nothophytophthora sp. Chile5]